MNKFMVYMHINKQNGKRYIGITSQDPVMRWANGKGYYRNKHFSDAINRYGWDGFEHVILSTNLDKESACAMEQKLIEQYKTTDKRLGYNLTTGGEFFKHSEESKKLMSKNRKGKGRAKRASETIERMKEHHSGGAEKVPVICIETGTTYGCINDASRATGINKKQISGCCRCVPHYNTAGGYHWKYA